MAKLLVSLPCYNEIASLLEKQGKQVNDGEPLMLEKGTAIMPPMDFRMATIRKDACAIAAQSWKSDINQSRDISYVDYAEEIFNYIIKGKGEVKATRKTKSKPATTKPNASGWG